LVSAPVRHVGQVSHNSPCLLWTPAVSLPIFRRLRANVLQPGVPPELPYGGLTPVMTTRGRVLHLTISISTYHLPPTSCAKPTADCFHERSGLVKIAPTTACAFAFHRTFLGALCPNGLSTPFVCRTARRYSARQNSFRRALAWRRGWCRWRAFCGRTQTIWTVRGLDVRGTRRCAGPTPTTRGGRYA